jgi:hypothetical protein
MARAGTVSTLERDRVLVAADWLCEFEGCGRDLTRYLSAPGVVPQISHIVAAADEGPRADPSMTAIERNRADNLMALCDECARLIDSAEGVVEYPAERLHAMKRAHEDGRAAARHAGEALAGSLGTTMYLNVARLVVDAAAHGQVMDQFNVGLTTSFDDMTIDEVGRLLVFADRVLPQIEQNALDLKNWGDLRRGGVGARFLFWKRVYARVFDRNGVPKAETLEADAGPHIYFSLRGHRIVLPIRPRYLTSMSARGWLSGSPSLIGLAQLRRLENNRAEMSPIVLAVPDENSRRSLGRLRSHSVFA